MKKIAKFFIRKKEFFHWKRIRIIDKWCKVVDCGAKTDLVVTKDAHGRIHAYN